jgi:deazaflavin-dependent oxidoreductase (nitroreductase family)
MSRVTSIVQQLGWQRWFSAVGRRLVPLDRWLMRHWKSRLSTGRLFGLPTLLLTTTGRRSGLPRTQPLLYVTDSDGALVVVGSNWGQRHQPAWSINLLADPAATAIVNEVPIPVRATVAAGTDRERLWQLLRAQWPAYEAYEQRAAGRQIRIFRLERRDPPPEATPA